jgi:hypothetical protein
VPNLLSILPFSSASPISNTTEKSDHPRTGGMQFTPHHSYIIRNLKIAASRLSFEVKNLNNSKLTKMKNTRMSLMSMGMAMASLLIVGQTQAQVINFDVPGATGETSLFGGGTYNLGVNYVGQGALSDPGNNYWNPVVFSGTTSGGLLSDGVTSSSITLTEAGLGGGVCWQ